jgi:peptidylprolyl isomerase
MSRAAASAAAVLALAVAGCGGSEDLRPGTGRAAAGGDTLTVQYVGVRYTDGKQFDASYDKGTPFRFVLEAKEVIPGWDQGLKGMKAGGRRELIVPPALGYGAQGSPPDIPPNATLVFVIDLLKVA